MAEDAAASIHVAFDALLAKVGGNAPTDPSKIASTIKYRIPSDCLALDCVLGGGLPTGRMVEIFGDPGEGKSTMIEHWLIQTQQMPGIAGLLLSEPKIDLARLEEEGCDMAHLAIYEPPSLEKGFLWIDQFLNQKLATKAIATVPGLIAWDTLHTAPLETELAGKIFGEGMMAAPRKIRKGLGVLALCLAQANTTLLISAQTMASPNPYLRNPATPGGGGPKFWASLRLYLKLKKFYNDAYGRPDGIVTNVKIVKSQVPGCLTQRKVPIYIGHVRGLDADFCNYHLLCEENDPLRAYTTARGWTTLHMPPPVGDVKFRWADFPAILDKTPGAREFLVGRVREKINGLLPEIEGEQNEAEG